MKKKQIKVSSDTKKNIINVSVYPKSKNEIKVFPIDPNKKLKNQINLEEIHFKPPYPSELEICYKKADFKDNWTWGCCRDWRKDSKSLSIINVFHNNYHKKKTWKEILNEKVGTKKKGMKKKHVFYEIQLICKEAQKRLVAISLDDWPEIFRFRLEGDFRFYGVTLGNVFLAVWHDTNHKIYPIDK